MSTSTRTRAAWDPKSYLADAASEHVLSVDAKAAATTIVNYYEFIASQLEERQVTQHVQEHALLQEGVQAASLEGSEEEEEGSSAEYVCVVRGVAMCVPFKVIVVVSSCLLPSEEGASAWRHAVETTVRRVFTEMHRVFGHHDDSLLRRMDAEDKVVITNTHLRTVLECALAVQRCTGGVFTVQGLRLRRCIRDAVRRGDGIPSDTAASARIDAFEHPSSPSSIAHTEFLEAVADLDESALCWGSTAEDVNGDASRVLHKRRGMPLDLDAISKGYSVDVLGNTLYNDALGEDEKASGVLVEWGGDVRVWGNPPSRCSRPHDASASNWILGIVLPPRLDTLYHRWSAAATPLLHPSSSPLAGDAVVTLSHSSTTSPSTESTNGETSYLHAVRLSDDDSKSGSTSSTPPSYCAMATSGDYAQVERFGFTNTVDVAAKSLLRAQGHTIASSSVVATSAMLADAMATALMACGELSIALQLIARAGWRGAAAASSALKGEMLQFYLYTRNHQELVHDEDDVIPGEGDAARAVLYSTGKRCTKALDEIQQATTATVGRHQQLLPTLPMEVSAATMAARRESSKVLLDDIRMMGTADAFHHTASMAHNIEDAEGEELYEAGLHHRPRPTSAVYSLSAAATSTSGATLATPEENHRRLLKQIGRDCVPHLDALIVFPSQAVSGLGRLVRDVQGGGGDVGHALSIARLSSVVLCSTGCVAPALPKSGRQSVMLTFNVMRGTPLFNAVVQAATDDAEGRVEGGVRNQPSLPLVLHLRSYSPNSTLANNKESLFSRDPKEWLHDKDARSATVPLWVPGDAHANSPAHSFATVVSEGDTSLVLTIRSLEAVGDHCVVLCEGTAAHPLPSAVPSQLQFPFTPVIIGATHRAHGPVGFVGFGLRMCSSRPLMVSVVFAHSVASQLLMPPVKGSRGGHGDLASPKLQICLLSSDAIVRQWFANGDFVFTPVPVSQLLRKGDAPSSLSKGVLAVLDCRLIEVVSPPLPDGATAHVEGTFHLLTASVVDVSARTRDGDEGAAMAGECFTLAMQL